jgi:hypothetical protein
MLVELNVLDFITQKKDNTKIKEKTKYVIGFRILSIEISIFLISEILNNMNIVRFVNKNIRKRKKVLIKNKCKPLKISDLVTLKIINSPYFNLIANREVRIATTTA